jgi:hypothetical protein
LEQLRERCEQTVREHASALRDAQHAKAEPHHLLRTCAANKGITLLRATAQALVERDYASASQHVEDLKLRLERSDRLILELKPKARDYDDMR